MRSQSYDLTKGSRGRYWRLVTVKMAPSSFSSQIDTGACRNKEGRSDRPTLPPTAPSPHSQALLLPLYPSPVAEGDSTSECEGWGGLVTPGLPHWGSDSPTQAASGPGGVEGVAVEGWVECRNPDPGDYCSPFPPALNPNPAEKQGAEGRRGKRQTES